MVAEKVLVVEVRFLAPAICLLTTMSRPLEATTRAIAQRRHQAVLAASSSRYEDLLARIWKIPRTHKKKGRPPGQIEGQWKEHPPCLIYS